MGLKQKISSIFEDEKYKQLCREDYQRLKNKVLAEIDLVVEKLENRLSKLQQIPKENEIWTVSYPLQMTIKEVLALLTGEEEKETPEK